VTKAELDERVPSYGVSEIRVTVDDGDRRAEEIEYLGYTVIESIMNVSELAGIAEAIDRYHERQVVETKTASIVMEMDADILRCPLVYDDLFLRIATLKPLMEVCGRLLGPHFVLLQQNAIINRPTTKEFQSRWHRDLPYQHFVASRRLALNALLCVDEFTLETGGTLVLPGTHMFEEFPSSQFVRKHERVVSAPAGSLLVMDAMLFHRAGYNISARNRRGVNHLIGRPLLVQQIDLPRLLDGRHAEDTFLRGFLGYQWNPASSVAAWRKQRS
jgi:ectoine hydroxylase-related dioxygenase (phytanoyl-CoA dioxygenase family)